MKQKSGKNFNVQKSLALYKWNQVHQNSYTNQNSKLVKVQLFQSQIIGSVLLDTNQSKLFVLKY